MYVWKIPPTGEGRKEAGMRILAVRVLSRRVSDQQRRSRRHQIAKELALLAVRYPDRKPVMIVAKRWRLAPRTIYAILQGKR